MTINPETTPATEVSPETARLKHEIEQTRDGLSETVAALEEKLAPSQVREAVTAELQLVEDRVREVIGDQLAQAKTLVSAELLEAKNILREGLSDADRIMRAGLRDAKASVRDDLTSAVTEARDAVRAATLGKVETFATTLGDSMNDARDSLIDTIYANPLPAALTGVGLAWLLMNRSRSSSARSRGYSGNGTRGTSVGAAVGNVGAAVGNAAHHVTDAVAEGVHGATDAAGNVMSGASDMISTVAHAAGEGAQYAAHTAREGAQYAAHTAHEGAAAVASSVQQGAKRVEETFQRQLRDRPLAIGAAALAMGTMVGCALPRTKAEDDMMGEARDSVLYRAGDVVHDAAATVAGLSEEFAQGDDDERADRPSA